jgi:hypothetical protein
VLLEITRKLFEFGSASEFRIYLFETAGVITVAAAGTGGRDRRNVAMGDAEIVEVADDLVGIVEGEITVELEAVGGGGTR